MSHFNQVANSWDTPEKIKLNQYYAKEISKALPLANPLKILEVGCGTGLLGSQFVKDQNSLLGIDTSVGMLEVFNQKFKDNKNVSSLILNLEENDLDANAQFDLIVSSMAFHHLKNPEAMISKLKTMLSPNGLIAIIDLDLEDGSFHPDPKNMGVFHFGFSQSTTKDWANKCKFRKFERKEIHIVKKESGDFSLFLALFFK